MNGEATTLELDPSNFKLSCYDNLSITMPQKPALSEDDIDAQLFEYVLSTNGSIKSVAELDDEWVKATSTASNPSKTFARRSKRTSIAKRNSNTAI